MWAVLQLVGSQRVTESPGLEVNLKISERDRQPPASQHGATALGATRRPRASAWRRHLGAFHVAQASFAVLLCHPPARCSEVRAPGRCPWGTHGACGILGWGEEVWGAESCGPPGSEQLSCTTGSPGTESASYPVLLTPSCKALGHPGQSEHGTGRIRAEVPPCCAGDSERVRKCPCAQDLRLLCSFREERSQAGSPLMLVGAA